MCYRCTRDRFTKARSPKDGEIAKAVLRAVGWDEMIGGIGVEEITGTYGCHELGCWTFTIVAEG